MGELVKHENPCPATDCNSSDALAIYKDDNGNLNGYCWSCGTYFPSLNENGEVIKQHEGKPATMSNYEYTIEQAEKESTFGDIIPKGIKASVAKMFGVRVQYNEETGEVEKWLYPRYRQGKFIGYKIKTKDKKFQATTDLSLKKSDYFGKNLIGNPRKMVIITEGEDDAMAAKQMLLERGKNYAVVSLSDGANKSSIAANLEWLDAWEHVVLCFDQDEPGKKAVEIAIESLTPGKVKVMEFSEKDANDMLLAGKSDEFYRALSNASMARPDGIISSGDTWERIKNRKQVESIPYPDGWDKINKMAYGMRLGDLDTWTSGSGMGKTQVLRILQKSLLDKTEDNIGLIALEEPLEDTIEALMALELKKRISLPDVRKDISEEEMYEAWKSTAGTNRIHLYDHFGSVNDDSLVKKIKYMARALDCKYIFLDHLSIVVSEFASEGGERERIDSIMTKLKNLTQELGIWIGLVVHLRKTQGSGKAFEEGGVPTLDDLRGSGAIKQLSNNVYALSRNQQHPDDRQRNISQLHVLKCRLSGRTGPADFLFFDDKTGWMVPVEDPAVDEEQEEEIKKSGF